MGGGSSKPVSNGAVSVLKYGDAEVIDALRKGTIRLVSVNWLLMQPPEYRIQRQQELIPRKGALMPPTVAAKRMAAGNRSVFALSHGWLSSGDPDPYGKRMSALREALLALKQQNLLPSDAGIFFDFASLPQKPRTRAEDASFKAGLSVMANLYASPLGVTVLQIKKIPPRPKEMVGALRLCGIPEKMANIGTLNKCYERFGLKAITMRTADEATLFFETKEGAGKALHFDPKALGLSDSAFVAHEYNDRAYDARGWCSFEDAVSLEFLGRSRKPGNDAMATAMDAHKRCKLYLIGEGGDPKAVDPSGPQDRVTIQKRIEAATFIGKGDRKIVMDMYKRFQLDAAKTAEKCSAAGKRMSKGDVDKLASSSASDFKARQAIAMENAVKRMSSSSSLN